MWTATVHLKTSRATKPGKCWRRCLGRQCWRYGYGGIVAHSMTLCAAVCCPSEPRVTSVNTLLGSVCWFLSRVKILHRVLGFHESYVLGVKVDHFWAKHASFLMHITAAQDFALMCVMLCYSLCTFIALLFSLCWPFTKLTPRRYCNLFFFLWGFFLIQY